MEQVQPANRPPLTDAALSADEVSIVPAPAMREERALFAIGLRLLAMGALAVMWATSKILGARGVHLVEIVFYRQALALPIVFAWIAFTQGARSVATKRIGAHLSRTVLGLIGLSLNFMSYALLPLTEATTIGFTMPIFGTILSALLLREATGIHRWGAVLLGFAGVLVMVRPGGGHFLGLGVGIAVAAAVVTACISILLRAIGRTEGAGVTVFWFTLLSMPILAVAMPFYAQAHDGWTWVLIVLLGVSGGIGQLCLTGALRWAPVSVVLPMDYSSIIWATLLGWLVWGEWPMTTTWIGAALIVASGLYIAWREHVRARSVRDLSRIAATAR
ncbi:DMT family transporter [soil metagenome]